MKKLSMILGAGMMLFLISGCCGGKNGNCSSGVCGDNSAMKSMNASRAHVIGTKTLVGLINSGKVLLFDARSGKHDDGFRIPTGKYLGYKCAEATAAKMIPNKDSLVVTYCSNLKCPASKRLADHLHTLGYTNVMEYSKGIAGWKGDGYKVVRAK